jgi:hypothetical protein
VIAHDWKSIPANILMSLLYLKQGEADMERKRAADAKRMKYVITHDAKNIPANMMMSIMHQK